MPLTKSGKKVKAKFKEEYGSDKGESVYYAYMKKNPVKTKKLHTKKRGEK